MFSLSPRQSQIKEVHVAEQQLSLKDQIYATNDGPEALETLLLMQAKTLEAAATGSDSYNYFAHKTKGPRPASENIFYHGLDTCLSKTSMTTSQIKSQLKEQRVEICAQSVESPWQKFVACLGFLTPIQRRAARIESQLATKYK